MLRKYYKIVVLVTILVSALLIFQATPAPLVFAYQTGHPDMCQPCHGPHTNTTDANVPTHGGTTTLYPWDHNITKGEAVWSYCTQCHDNYVAGTAHAGLGCKGCHAVLHMGYNASLNGWAAWIFAREPDLTAINDTHPLLKPSGNFNWVTNITIVTEDNASTTGYNFISNYGTGSGMEIEVGLWDAFNNKYSPIGGGVDWRVCFTCHFLSQNPASVGAYRLVGGKWKIGIPEYALKLPPHEITSAALSEAAKTESSTIAPSTLVGVLLGVLAVGLVIYSNREAWM